jgi:hypothetical protein
LAIPRTTFSRCGMRRARQLLKRMGPASVPPKLQLGTSNGQGH